VRYVNLDEAPLWECLALAALSSAFMVWRCWRLFDPATRLRSGAAMAAGLAAVTCSVLARRDAFGHGVELLVLVAVSFGIASIGKMGGLQTAAKHERDRKRGVSSPFAEADKVGSVVFLRLIGVALVLWLGYWLLVTHLR
jgi:hypothetical protein